MRITKLASMAQLMVVCLRASNVAWESVGDVPYGPDDVRAVGVTLFRECRGRGVGIGVGAEEAVPF